MLYPAAVRPIFSGRLLWWANQSQLKGSERPGSDYPSSRMPSLASTDLALEKLASAKNNFLDG